MRTPPRGKKLDYLIKYRQYWKISQRWKSDVLAEGLTTIVERNTTG